jgi:hypothetical protein
MGGVACESAVGGKDGSRRWEGGTEVSVRDVRAARGVVMRGSEIRGDIGTT